MPAVPRFQPAAVMAVGVLAVSTGAIFARLADSPALVTAAYRLGLACLFLIPVALWKTWGELRGLRRIDLLAAGAAGLFLALHFATWISSLDHTTVANSVVLVNTHPIWVGLLSPVIAKERIRAGTLRGIVLSVLGAGVIGAGDAALPGKAIWGDLLALAGGLCMAIYLLMGRKLRRQLSFLAYTALCYGTAAVLLWGYVLMRKLPVTGFDGTTWAALLAMALVAQLIGHGSYNWALKWFSAGLLAVTLLGEPIGATIMAYFIFGEGLTAGKLVGCGLILVAICLAAAGEAKRQPNR